MSHIYAKDNPFKNVISKSQKKDIKQLFMHTLHHSSDKPINITMGGAMFDLILLPTYFTYYS